MAHPAHAAAPPRCRAIVEEAVKARENCSQWMKIVRDASKPHTAKEG